MNESAKEFIISKIEYLRVQGKGISVYNAGIGPVIEVEDLLKTSEVLYKKITISNAAEKQIEYKFNTNEVILIFQDLQIEEFIKEIDYIVNKILFPAWYLNCSIFFFSDIAKSPYIVNSINRNLIHTDYNRAISLLLLEQFDELLSLVNYEFSTPDFLELSVNKTIFTPIEQVLENALIKNNIAYTPQVKLGRFYVDFILNINSRKIIVECDGRDYHNPYRDAERDKELSLNGYEIFHFSGSEIYRDINTCIKKIREELCNTSLNEKISDDLNEGQKIAVKHISGPMRVLAPAGSGKTKTLINRISNLVNSGIDQSEILALAFNTKAAQEMDGRLSNIGINNVCVRTFHSFGNQLVKKSLNWKFDSKNQEKITRKLLKQACDKHVDLKFTRNKDVLDVYLSTLSKAKMELLGFEEMTVETEDKVTPFEAIFKEYIGLQTKHNFYNYDDMLYLAVLTLLEDKMLRNKTQRQYKYILVDEFQDLNKIQLLLLQILSLPENNVFIVGDDDQMIYGFRGAQVRHILEFNKRYSISNDVALEINYRSSKSIVRHSKWLIDNNQTRVYKNIRPTPKASNGSVEVEIQPNLFEQAKSVADWILLNKSKGYKNWADFAVLYRYNSYRFIVAIVLNMYDIPHTPVDETQMLNSNASKDILSYIRVIYKTEESTAEDYIRILKRPNKYFTNEFINGVNCWEELLNSLDSNSLRKGWEIEKLSDFIERLKLLKGKATNQLNKPTDFIDALVNEFDLLKFYKDQSELSSDVDDASELINLEVIKAVAECFTSLNEFYGFFINLIKSKYEDDEENEEPGLNDKNIDINRINEDLVVLATIHKTKGKEFLNVGYFNLSNESLKDVKENQIEEERRVTYVGVTRPKDNILITATKENMSPFLKEYCLNPAHSNTSVDNLISSKENYERQLNIVKNTLFNKEEIIKDIEKKYPELMGENVRVNGPEFMKPFFINLRENKLKSAHERIAHIQKDINEVKAGYKEIEELVQSVEEEIRFREKLL